MDISPEKFKNRNKQKSPRPRINLGKSCSIKEKEKDFKNLCQRKRGHKFVKFLILGKK